MKTYVGITVMVLMLMGFSVAVFAQQVADTKSAALADIAKRQSKLDEFKACIEKSTQRSEIQICMPSLNFGATEIQADQRQMLLWKQQGFDWITKRQAVLDDVKTCVKASTTSEEVNNCQTALNQKTRVKKNFGAQ